MSLALPTLPPALLGGATRDYPLEVLLGEPPQPRDGERALLTALLPPWQRAEVWETARKVRFIEGIFLGLGTGYYVLHEKDWDASGALKPMAGWLIDGQQRLSAIRDFVQGRLTIFGGLRCGDLDPFDLRRRFLRVVFPCYELSYGADEQRLRDLYERLNFGGVPHTEADRQRFIDARPVAPSGNPMIDTPASWVLRNRHTGEVVMETFDPRKVAALYTAKYEAVPAAQYLGEFNRICRERGAEAANAWAAGKDPNFRSQNEAPPERERSRG